MRDLLLSDSERDKGGSYVEDTLKRALVAEIFVEGDNTLNAKHFAVVAAVTQSPLMAATLSRVREDQRERHLWRLVNEPVINRTLERCVTRNAWPALTASCMRFPLHCSNHDDLQSRIRERVRDGMPGCSFWKTPGDHAEAVTTLRAALGGGEIMQEGYKGYGAIVAALNRSPALKNNQGVIALLGQTYIADRRAFMTL